MKIRYEKFIKSHDIYKKKKKKKKNYDAILSKYNSAEKRY